MKRVQCVLDHLGEVVSVILNLLPAAMDAVQTITDAALAVYGEARDLIRCLIKLGKDE